MKSLLLSLPNLKRLSLALCQIVELECNERADYHYWPWLTSNYCFRFKGEKLVIISAILEEIIPGPLSDPRTRV